MTNYETYFINQPVRASSVIGARHAIWCAHSRTLAAIAMAAAPFLLQFSLPAAAQHIICCNTLIDVKGNWVGASRNCAGGLAKLSESERAKACETLKRDAPYPGAVCSTAAPCYSACDPKLYQEFQRKQATAMELFQHASDLRLQALHLIAERMGAEVGVLRIEAEKEVAGDLAWDSFGRHVQRGMRGSRSALDEAWLARKISQNAPFAVKAWNAIGWLDVLIQATARGYLTAGEWQRFQDEAQRATRAAEDMWKKALADFEAHLKQQPACTEEARKAAEEEKKLDRAKQVIEEWENNQVLYRDPITKEALTYQAALKRAKQLLDSGRISRAVTPFVRVATAPAAMPPSQQALEAAIKELDSAIAAFDRMDKAISAYLRAQYAIETKLRSAFGASAPPKKKPAVPGK